MSLHLPKYHIVGNHMSQLNASLKLPDLTLVLTSANSCVSLKAEFSNPRFFPGEVDKMKPKSMWIM